MQKILIIAALLFAATGNIMAQTQPRHIIRVIDARNFKEPSINWKNPDDIATYKADLARHKHHEVNVYHYAASTTGNYMFNYFQYENDTIQRHGFSISAPDNFDKAEYTWVKDTLNIHLFNGDKKSKTYKGFGWGGSSSLKVDD